MRKVRQPRQHYLDNPDYKKFIASRPQRHIPIQAPSEKFPDVEQLARINEVFDQLSPPVRDAANSGNGYIHAAISQYPFQYARHLSVAEFDLILLTVLEQGSTAFKLIDQRIQAFIHNREIESVVSKYRKRGKP